MSKVHWLIDVDLIEEQHLAAIPMIRAMGHEVTRISVTRDDPVLKADPQVHYTYLGSFEGLAALQKQGVSIATYGLGPSVLRSHYTSYIPSKWFLNHDSLMTTWGAFVDNQAHFHDLLDADDLFVRPDSGKKTFSGQVISCDGLTPDFLAHMDRYTGVLPHSLIWLSASKPVGQEYRCWIGNRSLITFSEYSWDRTTLAQGTLPASALKLVDKVTSLNWQMDLIYTLDISVVGDQASIIELNSFSCAGLYACDATALFPRATQLIWDEFNL